MVNREKFFNISHDIFCILDHSGNFKEVNPSFTKVLAYRREEILDQSFLHLVHPEDKAVTKAEYEAVVYGIRNKIIANRLKDKSGYYHWISWSSIVFDKSGFYYVAGQNISENIQLQEALSQQQRLSQQRITKAIIQTQEKERSEISRELHDNVNQVLTTIKLLLTLCRSNELPLTETLDKVIGLQQNAINEIRTLSKRLSAPSLGSLKLEDSISDLVNAMRETNRINIALNTSGIDGLDLEPDVHLAVYRIMQEQFTNILKHAAATEVIITLDFSEGALMVVVTDNGVGFDPKDVYNGIGLTNMRTRAESVGGAFTIKSAPGQGSTLVVRIPLERED